MTKKPRQTASNRLGRKQKPKRGAATHERAFQASHESERQFHEMFDQAVVGITRTDPNGVLVDVNEKFCEMLGYSRDELVGRHNRDITHPDDYGHGAKFREEAMQSGSASAISNEKRFLRKDGTYIWARRTLSAARDEEGRPQYVVAVVEDITERKVLEQRFRDTFEQAAVGIFHADLDGRYLRVNRKLCEITGYTEEELTGPSRPSLSFPGDFDSGGAERKKLLSGKISSHSNEKRYIRKDGTVIWVNRTESLARDEAGNPLYMIRVVEDITGRKEAERQFRENFEQAAVGIVHVDFDNRYIRVNRKFCEITGYSETELIGKSASGPSHPDDVGSGNMERDRLRAGEIFSFSNEKRYIRKDGTTIWVKRTESITRDGAGKPLYCIRVVEDITDRKEAAERYRATFDSAPVGIMHTAIDDDRILSANSRLCEMLGYTQGELCRVRTDDLIPPDYVNTDRLKYREKMLRGELDSFSSERKLIRKDGEVIWVNRTVSLVRDAAGRPDYFIRVVEDVSERKHAVEAIARERALLRTIIDTVPDYVYVKDAEGRFQLANKAWLRERNLDNESIAGKTVFDIFAAEMAERMAAQDAQIVKTGIPIRDLEQKVAVKAADGSIAQPKWVSITKVLMQDASGEVIGTVGTSRDITEQKLSAQRRDMEHAVTRLLAEAASVNEVMPKLIETVCLATGWSYGAHWSWSGAEQTLVREEFWSELALIFDGEEMLPWTRLRVRNPGGLVGRAWFEKQPVWIEDLRLNDSFNRRNSAIKLGMRSAFSFPVVADGDVIGIMEFFGREARKPDEILLQIVGSIGRQIGQFIQRKEAEWALRTSEEHYRDVFEASPLPMWVWDDETLDIVAVNQAAVAHYGYSRDEFLRMNVREMWEPRDAGSYEEVINKRTHRQDLYLVCRLHGKDGHVVDAEVTARRFALGRRSAWLTLVNDITVRKHAEAALRESEEQFRQLAGNIPQVFWITDTTHRQTLYVSPAAEAMLGCPLEDILSNRRTLIRAVHEEDRLRVFAARRSAAQGGYDETFRIVRPDGSIRWVHDRAFPVDDAEGNVYRIAGIAEDITDRKRAEERLMQMAHYDLLTSLPNRVLFYDRLKQALAQAKRNQWTMGVLFIDLDRFKNVNDTLGHTVGDQLLQQVSERLTSSVRAGDTVGRLGGDEFAIVLSDLNSGQDAHLVAQKIMAGLGEPFRLDGAEIFVTASIGITLYPDDSADQDALIKNADAAMYRAKEVGRNGYQFYTPEMNARSLEVLNMESSLRRALDRSEFLLHYQPKASVADGHIVGVEALLRWRHPERGTVAPGEFMTVLEETGLIVPVGEWVLKAVCTQIKAWESAGIRPVPVAVNLSARQFAFKDLGPTIQRILQDYQVDPALIELELTESSLMVNTEEAVQTLEFLERLGTGLSIDDFGTGYSSLAYLKRFPLDSLKIDRSFVRDVTTDPDDAAIIRAVISMAHSLGLKVIAEGVETEPQLAFLAGYGCDEIQGYYLSRPIEADECGVWLKERRSMKSSFGGAYDAPVVLLVDDDDASLALLGRSLSKDGYRILTAQNVRSALNLLSSYRVDVVISGQNMPDVSGEEFLQRVKLLSPRTVRMLTSSYTNFHAATTLANKGEIFRFLPKDSGEDHLRASVRDALRSRAGQAEVDMRIAVSGTGRN